MHDEFIRAIVTHQPAFGLELSDDAIERLANFYILTQKHNEFLHLVGPCSPDDFAIRHTLESLALLEYLPAGSKFADVGTGAGLPSIPCLLVRDDLRALLIESKEKKSNFLELAVETLGLLERVTIVSRQFQEVDPADCNSVTCRALDKFTEKLPRLLRWSAPRRILLFGGKNLSEALQQQRVRFAQRLMPMSEQRFLFILDK